MASMLILANWQITLLSIAFVLVCLFMMLVILIQKPKGGGLSGAFGGAGGSAQAAFGAKTGDVLTWFTVTCFVLFLLLAMGLTWAIRPEHLELVRQLEAQQTAEESDLGSAMEEALEVPGPVTDETEPDAAAEAAESYIAPDQLVAPVPEGVGPDTAVPAPGAEAEPGQTENATPGDAQP